MAEIIGTNNKVLIVDLTTQTTDIYKVADQERLCYLGAKGLGLKLLYDRQEPGADPLGPDNHLAFMPGVLMGTGAPCSGRFFAVTKSPQTGIFASSSCGGPFGMQLKTAGWDGLLIKGKAEKPTYLYIDENGVEFREAAELWGLETTAAQEKLDAKRQASVVIGPAGENLVRFANIRSGHRFLGRGGMGAVMGAKNLKAVVAKGGAYKIRPVDTDRFDRHKKRATKYINTNEMTSDVYRKYGTAANARMNQEGGILPVNNFRDGKHPDFDEISGQTMAAKYDTSPHTCKPCTIMCGHKGTIRGETRAIPEFETVGLLGSNLGIFDSDAISDWNEICGRMGMDTISSGGTLAWVMEATENGLIDTDLRFGSTEGISQALEDIAYRRGFGDDMANGSRWLSTKYGGTFYAMHVKGLEMAAYDPRGSFGQGLNYAVANRGACHLSAYLSAQEVFFKMLSPQWTMAKAKWVRFFESLTACINSLQACQFTMFAYLFESPVVKINPTFVLWVNMQLAPEAAMPLVDMTLYRGFWSSITGQDISLWNFFKAGDRIHTLERYMNTREGISRTHDTLPPRMLREGRPCDPKGKPVPLNKMLDSYYKLRGYNRNGIPKPETLIKLGIV